MLIILGDLRTSCLILNFSGTARGGSVLLRKFTFSNFVSSRLFISENS
jgi:hypothetical protein